MTIKWNDGARIPPDVFEHMHGEYLVCGPYTGHQTYVAHDLNSYRLNCQNSYMSCDAATKKKCPCQSDSKTANSGFFHGDEMTGWFYGNENDTGHTRFQKIDGKVIAWAEMPVFTGLEKE